MTPWILLPVKPFRAAKSRLATVLSDEQRFKLAHSLWLHTIQAIRKSRFSPPVMIISRDEIALAYARENRIAYWREGEHQNLNESLASAVKAIQPKNVSSVLIVPVDLPLLTTTHLDELISKLPNQIPSAAIVPDRRGEGTNILFLAPPELFPFHYGPHSFRYHQEAAQRVGVSISVMEDPVFAADVDLPEDLAFIPPKYIAI
jgi:2-phospho-L-lactate/phosphoenolpyruvate guanylyltransferase